MAGQDGDDKADRQFVASLARGLSILAAFGPDDRSLSNHELAERTGLPRPTVSRFTHTLCKLNYLVHQERLGRFSLAPRVVELSQAAQAATGIKDIARPAMEALSEIGDVSVALGVPSDLSIRYIELARRPEAIVLNLDVGAKIPLAQTAIGRAYLANLPESARAAVIDRLKAEQPEVWAQQAEHVARAVEAYDAQGYAQSFGDWRPELHAIATAIHVGQEAEPLFLSVSGLSSVLTPELARSLYAPAMLGSARTIETRMRRHFLG